MAEADFIAALRGIATDPAARGLLDDAAVLDFADRKFVLTHDMIVEGVHFLSHDPPADVAWKLLAVNLSDLAAKGAKPLAVLLGYTLGSADWDRKFAEGLRAALGEFDIPLLGGDTVAVPAGYLRSLGMTAIGETEHAPSRTGAKPGDSVWVSGFVGNAYAGLGIAKGRLFGPSSLRDCYRRPRPKLALGQALAPHVNAMMDISDGLLLDLDRLARAAGVSASIDLDAIPLSEEFIGTLGGDRDARIAAATGGDDYELLFTLASDREGQAIEAAEAAGVPITHIGHIGQGEGLAVRDRSGEVPLPERLGYQHG